MADAAAKRDRLRRARCLLFPVQWEEPFGMVMTEAMACGTPVVALSRGAVSEIVIDGLTGVLCHHPSELASALADVTRIDPVAVASTSPGGTPSRTSLPATSGHTEAC